MWRIASRMRASSAAGARLSWTAAEQGGPRVSMSIRALVRFIAILLFIDQATKYAVKTRIPEGAVIRVLPFFNITHTENTGIAFSMFQGGNSAFVMITVVLIAGFLFWYRILRRQGMRSAVFDCAFGCIMAGAAGNLLDRIFNGAVIDFLDVYVKGYHWPAFNIADSGITIGGTVMFIYFLLSRQNSRLAALC